MVGQWISLVAVSLVSGSCGLAVQLPEVKVKVKDQNSEPEEPSAQEVLVEVVRNGGVLAERTGLVGGLLKGGGNLHGGGLNRRILVLVSCPFGIRTLLKEAPPRLRHVLQHLRVPLAHGEHRVLPRRRVGGEVCGSHHPGQQHDAKGTNVTNGNGDPQL